MESYCFDRAEHPWLAGYKPLDLLEHVGGRPLVLKSYRSTITVAQYDMATKWLARAYDRGIQSAFREIFPALTQNLLGEVKDARRALDAGCGQLVTHTGYAIPGS